MKWTIFPQVGRLEAQEGDTLLDLAIRNNKRKCANVFHDLGFHTANSDFQNWLSILTQPRRRAFLEACVRDPATAQQKRGINFTPTTTPSDEPEECCICMDRPRNSRLLPCAHAIVCSECAAHLLGRQDTCPVCRSIITKFEEGDFKYNFEQSSSTPPIPPAPTAPMNGGVA